MSNTATFPITTEITGSWHGIRGITSRTFAAAKAAYARRVERQAYEDLLQSEDHVLRDIGVSRGEVRQALMNCR